MDLVDLKLTINVSFGTMTMDQYQRIQSFFLNRMPDDSPISNEEIIKYLSLDKRPFAVSSIQRLVPDSREGPVSNATIELIC